MNSRAAERYAEAVRDHRDGRLAAAETRYRSIVRDFPGHADALHMLGVIASGKGDLQGALRYFREAASLAPENAGFLNNLGVAARAAGHADEAVAAFRDALRADPASTDARCNLGNALLAQGDDRGAGRQYALALETDPASAGARGGLAAICRRQGDLDGALALYGALARERPDDAAAQNNLGVVHMERGAVEDAIYCYSNVLEKDYNNLESLNNLSVALLAKGDGTGAEAILRRLIALAPDLAIGHANLGNALRRQGRRKQAAESYHKALSIRDEPGVQIRLATLLPVIATSSEDLAGARAGMEAAIDALLEQDIRIDDPIGDVGITHFHLSYHDTDNRELNSKIARLYAKACPQLCFVAPHCGHPARREGRRRKIGFVSQYLRNHAVGWCYHRILRRLSTDRISVSAFTFRDDGDPLWRAIADDVDAAVILPMNLAAARERLAQEELDILIYTDIGMEPLTYFLAFARLAPVQCVTNGHPDTTGIPTIDYFISSAPLEGTGAAESYSETLVALDGVLVEYDRPARPDPLKPRAAFGLPNDTTLYVCPQSLFKIHPEMDASVARILAADASNRLVIFAGPEPHWAELLFQRWKAGLGKNINKVIVLERQSYPDFLNILCLADIVLDTWPFSGGNTAYQGLAMGTPIVTLPGRFARGRSTMALYRRLDITETIAESSEEYAEIAIRLGKDRQWRSGIAARIAERADCLFGDSAAADAFARFLSSVGADREGTV